MESDAAPLCVLAGPGSGKTRVLTQRIARRVEDGTADPRRVLALTFTRRAANEVRQRLANLGIRDLGAVGTFHAVALAQLRRHAIDHGRTPPAVIGQRRPILRDLHAGRSDGPLVSFALAASEIDWACAQGLVPDEYRHGPGRQRVGDGSAVAIAELHRRFVEYKRRRHLMDFDDLLVRCHHLLVTDPAFADAQRWLFRHIFVDEYQDLNPTQFDLLSGWLGDRSDLFVVGDPNQAIYGWNGANADYLTGFADHFPTATVLELTTNHRSTPTLVRLASTVVGGALPETSENEIQGPAPAVTSYPDEQAEAIGIARHLRHQRQPGQSWARHAVLARTNEQLTIICRALDQLDVPYRLRGRGGLLRLPEVAQVVEQLVAAGPDIAVVAADLLAEIDGGPAAHIATLAQQYLDEDPAPDGRAFNSWLRTVSPADLDRDHDAVDLVTFHAAKGLEWPHVVIAGMEEGLVPLKASDPEERRLFYVAVTRAERSVHLTWARHRTVSGQVVERQPSPWLAIIEGVETEPPPTPPDRFVPLLAQARAAVGAAEPLEQRRRRDRLTTWRDRTARARRISAQAVLDDATIALLAVEVPRDLDDLAEVTGTRPERLRSIGPEILAQLAGE